MSLVARCSLALVLLLPAFPAALGAQVLPIPRQTDWEQERQRYLGEALREFNRMLNDWRAAAEADDARAASRFYTSAATLHFQEGAPAEGRAAIERKLQEVLPTIGGLRTGVSDFSASSNLAFAVGRFWYDEAGSDGIATGVTGTYMVVAERQGRDWRIRSQMFKPETVVQ
jgi:ketosteroid isomerase-like protein